MKVLYLSTSLALITLIVAQADPAAADAMDSMSYQPAYAWAGKLETLSDDQCLALRGQLADAASEPEFRSLYLGDPSQSFISLIPLIPDPKVPSTDPTLPLPIPLPDIGAIIDDTACLGIKTVLIEGLKRVSSLTSALVDVPVLGVIAGLLDKPIKDLIKHLQGETTIVALNVVLMAGKALITFFETLLNFAVLLPDPKIGDLLKSFVSLTGHIKATLDCFAGKAKTGANSNLQISPSSFLEEVGVAAAATRCDVAADLYRAAVKDALLKFPALAENGDENDSEAMALDRQRVMEGTRSVLKLMAKYTIAADNAKLLETRAVFVGSMLDEYREELVRLAATDEQATFARVSLSALVGASNALEACVAVAVDPLGAQQELKLEMADEDENEEMESVEDIE